MASDETRKSHQKEKEKIDRVKGKRGEEKKLRSIFLEKDIF